MKQALILLQETGGKTPSGSSLTDFIAPELSDQLMQFMFEQTLAEVYPVDGEYRLFLLSYDGSQQALLEQRLGSAFQYMTAESDTFGDVIQQVMTKLPDTDRFVFLKSNGYGWTEDGVRDLFHRLGQYDVIYAPGGVSSFFLVGFVRESGEFLCDASGWDTETVDALCDQTELTAFHLPQQPLVESLKGMTDLRERLPNETALAKQIDEIVLKQTRHEESEDA